MSRGGSYGGGQSSLGYLFGSSGQDPPPSPSKTVMSLPPYGVDTEEESRPVAHPPPAADQKQQEDNNNNNNNYHRAHGQNSGNFITERPSTKVKSVPGGSSSLGYLFGDK